MTGSSRAVNVVAPLLLLSSVEFITKLKLVSDRDRITLEKSRKKEKQKGFHK